MKDPLSKTVMIFKAAEQFKDPSRATFLEDCRGEGDIQRTLREKLCEGIGCMFRGQVIKIGADFDNLLKSAFMTGFF